uniref:Uncharacterized protein n=1 Tax=Zea mays TaxID=4577 RepID=A0A804UFH7_MAIZE
MRMGGTSRVRESLPPPSNTEAEEVSRQKNKVDKAYSFDHDKVLKSKTFNQKRIPDVKIHGVVGKIKIITQYNVSIEDGHENSY